MRAAKVQASLRIRAVSPEPPLLAHTSSESRGTFRQKARSLAPLNGWACAVKICHDGMLEDTNSLDGAQMKHWTISFASKCSNKLKEKSRECHNQKPQPTSDTKRKRKRTKHNTYKTNKQMQEKHKDSSPSEVIIILKGKKTINAPPPSRYGQKHDFPFLLLLLPPSNRCSTV